MYHRWRDEHNQSTSVTSKPDTLHLESRADEPIHATATHLAGDARPDQGDSAPAAARKGQNEAVRGILLLARQVALWGAMFGTLNVPLALATERLLAIFAGHQGTDQHQTFLLACFSLSLLAALAPPFFAGHLATRRLGNARLGSLAGAWCALVATLLLFAALMVFRLTSADREFLSYPAALLLSQLAIGLVLGALGGKYTRWQRIWKKRLQGASKTFSTPSAPADTPQESSSAPLGIRLRWRRVWAWCARPDVRAAFAATLGLRLGCSGVVVLATSVKPGAFFLVGELPVRYIEHLSLYPPPLTVGGLADYFSVPWSHWDTHWYTGIAVYGYGGYGSTAFMPLYPYMIRWLGMLLGGHYMAAALLISTISCFGVMLCLYRLIEQFSLAPAARWGLIVAVLLPVSFFLVAGYTEAFFLWVSLGAILAFLNRQWGRMAALAILASLTRNQGILLSILTAPAIIGTLWGWISGRGSIRGWHSVARALYGPMLAALAGPIAYLGWVVLVGFVWRMPFPWEPLGSVNGWNLHFTLPGVGIVADLIALAHPSVPSTMGLPSLALDAGAAILAGIAILVMARRLPLAIVLYAIATWCLALVKVLPSDQTMSTARYLLPILLLAILPGKWLAQGRPLLRLGWIVAGGVLLFFFTWYFVIGAWVD